MYILSAVLLTAICAADVTLELLDTFTEIRDMNETVESCAYDTVNDKWIFFSNDGESVVYNTLPGSYPDTPLEDGDFVQGADSIPLASTIPLGTMFVAGTPNKVYIASFIDSAINSYNIDDGTFTVNEFDIPSPPGPNGICYDEENDALYAAATGLNWDTGLPLPGTATIYKISGISDDPMNVTFESIPTSPLNDQNGEVVLETNTEYAALTGTNRVLHPNGCTVYDGKVYFVETRYDDVGNLGIYDIESGELTLNTEILSGEPNADGIIVMDDYLIYSSFGSDSVSPHMGYYDLNQYPEGTFTKALMNTINNGADISYNPNTNVICVPYFDGSTPSSIEFVRFTVDEDMPSTTMLDESAANYVSVMFTIITTFIFYIML